MKFLIIDKMHESIGPLLTAAGYDWDYQPNMDRAGLLDSIEAYEGLVVRSKTTVDTEVLSRATRLKIIARAGAGLDKLELEAIANRDIAVVNAPEGNRDALAEHAMGLLLSLLNHIVPADQEVRKGVWDREGNRGYELQGKTVGLIGFGYMGQAFAHRLRAFGVQILAYDKYQPKPEHPYARPASLEEIQSEADILSFHVPLTTETRMHYDAAFFAAFAKPIWLLNTARGGVLDLQAVIDGLDSGRIMGAALDVLENEKLTTMSEAEQARYENLTARKNLIFSPHVGGWTFESYRKINETLVQKIKSWTSKFS